MEQVTVENFRCFREKQTARLAPLTLLVGDNSTGKTSFLALLRVLWDIGHHCQFPDFKEDPYDLGSFDELANRKTTRDSQPKIIRTGFKFSILSRNSKQGKSEKKLYEIEACLSKKGVTPVVSRLFYRNEETWIEAFLENGDLREVGVGTHRGRWKSKKAFSAQVSVGLCMSREIPFWFFVSHLLKQNWKPKEERIEFQSMNNSPPITEDDLSLILDLATFRGVPSFESSEGSRPFASAPVRSEPQRKYDPSQPIRDPQGSYLPMYLVNVYLEDKEKWISLKDSLEQFGQSSGLFDEISIKQLKGKDSGLFQVQIREFSDKMKGLQRNLIDVGYGVSQILPVIIELLHKDATPMFLFQQPEVHLHPSAQAALGSFFCKTASWNRQIIVETHSDYLLNRIRMDVCEGKGQLKPDDVSILFFERAGLDVRIHSIRIDDNGNIVDQPPGYRQFFNDEMRRSLRV